MQIPRHHQHHQPVNHNILECMFLSFRKEHDAIIIAGSGTCVEGGGGTGCVSCCTLHTLCCIVLRAVMKCIKRWQLVPSQRR